MASERLTISLPTELLDFVRERTAVGEYTSDSEVIRDGLRLLKERDRAVQQWLKTEVVPAYLQFKANPGSALSREELEAQLREDRQRRRTKQQGSAE